MSYQDPTAQFPTGPATVEYQPLPPPPEDPYIDDDDEEWVNQAPKGLRIPPVTGILVLVLFAVCGLWSGAVLQKHHDKSTRTTTAAGGTGAAGAAAAAGRRAAAGGGTGTAFGGGVGGRTIGTVSDVEGSTVFVTDASGSIVKINLAPGTKITKTTSATAADIQLGQTIVVTGAKGTDGSTSAATITVGPPGVAAPATGATGTGATGGG